MQIDKEKIYVIICPEKDIELGEIINSQRRKEDFYIVNNPILFNFPGSSFTPKIFIKWHTYKKNNEFNFKRIIDLLEMEDVKYVYDKKWKYIGNFKWICSVAVGIAQGKKYFIMPWLSKCELDYQEYRLEKIFKAMEIIGGTIVCPVESIEGKEIFESTVNMVIKSAL